MLVITENITNRTIAYAENDAEYIESLFTPVDVPGAENNRGTLAIFHKIQKRKNEILYWTTENKGYFERKDGLFGQFGKIEGGKYDGKLWFQWTCAEIKRQ